MKYVVSPETRKVHKQGDGNEPACRNRLHNTNVDEWRLSIRKNGKDECKHPECFGSEPVCDICDEDFKRDADLIAHMGKVHDDY